FISLDGSTSKWWRLDVAKILLSTSHPGLISEVIPIKVNEQLFSLSISEEISADGIFKNYECDGSKRTFTGSNYDPPSEVSKPPPRGAFSPRDESDQSLQSGQCSDDANKNQEHSLLSPIRSYRKCLVDSHTSQSKHEAGGRVSCRSCGDLRGSRKLFPAWSNRPSSDDYPHTLGLVAKRSPVPKSLGNSCSADAASVTNPGKSNAFIVDPTMDAEAFGRSNWVV
ncbi:hypothetical protein Ancab_004578, partial [Ancistrocladus abbreviatus]